MTHWVIHACSNKQYITAIASCKFRVLRENSAHKSSAGRLLRQSAKVIDSIMSLKHITTKNAPAAPIPGLVCRSFTNSPSLAKTCELSQLTVFV
jgi:hypothetical protein